MINKKLLAGGLAFWLAISLAGAQDSTVYRFSLKEAQQYALENNIQLENAHLDVDQSRQSVSELLSTGLPQISGTVSYQNFVSLPTSLIPAEFLGGQPGDYIEVQFGTSQNAKASVNASQLIFDGSYLIGLKASKMFVELTRKQTKQTERDILQQVEKAYYLALVSQRSYELASQNLQTVEDMLRETEAMYKEGLIESVEVDRLKLSRSNVQLQMQNTHRQLVLSYQLLKFQMGMPLADSLVLTGSLDDFITQGNDLLEQSFNYMNRIEYDILNTQALLTEINIKRYRAGYYPSLRLIGNYSQEAQRNAFDFFQKGQPWFETALWGITLNVPIFDSFQKRATIQKEKINLMKIENARQQLQESMKLEVEQARMNYMNAAAQLNTQQQNLDLAQRILNTARIKYNEGVGSSLEVNNAQATLFQTQTAYVNALYSLLVARSDLEKALGIYNPVNP